MYFDVLLCVSCYHSNCLGYVSFCFDTVLLVVDLQHAAPNPLIDTSFELIVCFIKA